MTNPSWVQHMVESTGLTVPKTREELIPWRKAHREHLDSKCPECMARRRTNNNRLYRQAREDAYRSLGLVKVKGLLGGTYWE